RRRVDPLSKNLMLHEIHPDSRSQLSDKLVGGVEHQKENGNSREGVRGKGVQKAVRTLPDGFGFPQDLLQNLIDSLQPFAVDPKPDRLREFFLKALADLFQGSNCLLVQMAMNPFFEAFISGQNHE